MTTFTSDDLDSFKTPWFPVEIDPVHEGEYEVMGEHWPWPHRAEWTKKAGWTSINVEQWRGLKEKAE